MTVFTLSGYTPPERFDDVAWVSARLEQSTTETGSYTLLEAFDLDPVDADPSNPLSRSFTTELATIGDWYRLVFVDADGIHSDPTSPVENSAGVDAFATSTELAAILKVTEATNQTALDRVLLAAAGEITSEIGRADLAGWELALATEVNLERAVEHWQQMKSAFGIIGLGSEVPMHAGRDSWDRHAKKLAPLKSQWGLA